MRNLTRGGGRSGGRRAVVKLGGGVIETTHHEAQRGDKGERGGSLNRLWGHP